MYNIRRSDSSMTRTARDVGSSACRYECTKAAASCVCVSLTAPPTHGTYRRDVAGLTSFLSRSASAFASSVTADAGSSCERPFVVVCLFAR